MSFLDWIKRRDTTSQKPEKELSGDAFARQHGHASVKTLWAEIRNDEKLAQARDAMGREPDDLPAESRHHTSKGNAISVHSSSTWASDGVGVYELRHHVGKSIEGYHGGLEASHRGGEGSWSWSNASPTKEGAEQAACEISDRWTRDMQPELERVETLQQEYSKSRDARITASKEKSPLWER